MGTITVCLIVFLAFIGAAVLTVAWLRQKPGLRRRREDPDYEGPARRTTDCNIEIERAVQAALHQNNVAPYKNIDTKVEADDTIKQSRPRAPRKPKVVK